ncbi:hypothetical protein WUBG_05904, partial [Wuchereria bancrofti]
MSKVETDVIVSETQESTAFSAIGEERKESLVVRKAGQDSKAASFPRGMDHLLELLIIHSPTFYHHVH